MLNLDTQIVVYIVNGTLRADEKVLLDREEWSISAVVLWELAKLVQLSRIHLDFEDREVIDLLDRLHVWPIDLAIARASTQLDFRSDPADELIAATSVVHRVPLLTRDRRLRASTVVPLAL